MNRSQPRAASRSSVRVRTVLVALIAALATSGVLLAAPGEAGAARPTGAGPARAANVLAVGTFNINAAQRFKVWRRAIEQFRPHVQLAGIQEVNSDRKRAVLRRGGWDAFWPNALKQNPVIWDRDDFELISGRGAKIAQGRYVGHEHPGAPTYRKASRATVVRLRQVATGQTLSVVNVHLTAGGVQNGRRVRGNPRLYRLYVDEVRGLVPVVRQEQQWAEGRVLVLGDFNNNYPADRHRHYRRMAYSRMTGLGLVSAWESRGELRPGRGSGTRAGSYLDNVWAPQDARRISVLRSILVSDHYPVVATYPVTPPA